MGYYGASGAAATTYNQFAVFLEKLGPSSYATGGFTIDLSSTFSTLNAVRCSIKKGTRGNCGWGRFEYTLNSPGAGQVTVKVQKHQYTTTSAFGNVTGQPSGVTVQSSSGQTTSSESTHTHDATHDHAASTSGTPSNSGAGVGAAGASIATHTHSFDLPSMSVTSGVGASHNHTDNSVYQHQHSVTQTATNDAIAEIANTTDLSATTFYVLATGVRA